MAELDDFSLSDDSELGEEERAAVRALQAAAAEEEEVEQTPHPVYKGHGLSLAPQTTGAGPPRGPARSVDASAAPFVRDVMPPQLPSVLHPAAFQRSLRSAAALRSAVAAARSPRVRALVVNTGSFKCRYLMRHPGLHGADCDALALHLRHPHLGALPEGAVTRVVDPIRSELIAAFTDLAAAVRDAHRDVVLVYVAGPALRVAKRGKQKGSYLVLRDTELKRDAGRFAASALSAADLGALLASIPCRQRLCLLDMVPEVSDGARRGAGGGDAAPATPDDADAAAVASEAEKEAESSAAGATTVTGEASGTGDGGAAPVANTAAPAPAPARSRSLRGMLGKRKRASDFRPRSLRQLPRGVQFVPGTDCYTAVYEASLGAHVVGACKLPSAVAPSKQRESQVRLMGVAQSMWARRLMLALSPAGEGDEHCAADPAGAITLHDAVAHLLAQLPRDAEERARDMAGRVVDKKRADRERESAAAGGDEGADEGGGGDEETPEEREKRREERRAKAEKEEEATRHKMEKAFFRALTPVYEGPGFETRLEAIVVARSGAAAQPRDRGVLSRLRGATAQSVGGRFLQSAARTASAVAQRVQEARGGGNGADNAPEKGFDLLVFPANTVAAVAPALRVPREAIAPPRQAVAGLDEGNALGLAAEREGGKKRDADPPRLALALDDSGGPAAGSRVSVELPFTAFLHPLPRPPPPPEAPRLVRATRSSITLEWQPAPFSGRPPVDFELQLRGTGRAVAHWHAYSRGVVTVPGCCVTQLPSGFRFQFRVRARNVGGSGPFSKPSAWLETRSVNVTSPRDRLAWLAREGTFWNVLEFLREKRNDADAAHWACRQLIARMRQGHRPRPGSLVQLSCATAVCAAVMAHPRASWLHQSSSLLLAELGPFQEPDIRARVAQALCCAQGIQPDGERTTSGLRQPLFAGARPNARYAMQQLRLSATEAEPYRDEALASLPPQPRSRGAGIARRRSSAGSSMQESALSRPALQETAARKVQGFMRRVAALAEARRRIDARFRRVRDPWSGKDYYADEVTGGGQ